VQHRKNRQSETMKMPYGFCRNASVQEKHGSFCRAVGTVYTAEQRGTFSAIGEAQDSQLEQGRGTGR
jgi:hypothetical protein